MTARGNPSPGASGMTVAELIDALMALPDLSASVVLIVDGRAISVRAVTSSDLEPRPGVPAGAGILRGE